MDEGKENVPEMENSNKGDTQGLTKALSVMDELDIAKVELLRLQLFFPIWFGSFTSGLFPF